MTDIIGKLFLIPIVCVLLYIMPALIITLKQDDVSQGMADKAVETFVDNAKATGKISPNEYLALCNDIDKTGLQCQIELNVSKKFTRPEGTGYETYSELYNKDEIVKEMFPPSGENKYYPLKQGDYIEVRVRNTAPSLGVKIANMLYFHDIIPVVYSDYGGYVGNVPQ